MPLSKHKEQFEHPTVKSSSFPQPVAILASFAAFGHAFFHTGLGYHSVARTIHQSDTSPFSIAFGVTNFVASIATYGMSIVDRSKEVFYIDHPELKKELIALAENIQEIEYIDDRLENGLSNEDKNEMICRHIAHRIVARRRNAFFDALSDVDLKTDIIDKLNEREQQFRNAIEKFIPQIVEEKNSHLAADLIAIYEKIDEITKKDKAQSIHHFEFINFLNKKYEQHPSDRKELAKAIFMAQDRLVRKLRAEFVLKDKEKAIAAEVVWIQEKFEINEVDDLKSLLGYALAEEEAAKMADDAFITLFGDNEVKNAYLEQREEDRKKQNRIFKGIWEIIFEIAGKIIGVSCAIGNGFLGIYGGHALAFLLHLSFLSFPVAIICGLIGFIASFSFTRPVIQEKYSTMGRHLDKGRGGKPLSKSATLISLIKTLAVAYFTYTAAETTALYLGLASSFVLPIALFCAVFTFLGASMLYYNFLKTNANPRGTKRIAAPKKRNLLQKGLLGVALGIILGASITSALTEYDAVNTAIQIPILGQLAALTVLIVCFVIAVSGILSSSRICKDSFSWLQSKILSAYRGLKNQASPAPYADLSYEAPKEKIISVTKIFSVGIKQTFFGGKLAHAEKSEPAACKLQAPSTPRSSDDNLP